MLAKTLLCSSLLWTCLEELRSVSTHLVALLHVVSCSYRIADIRDADGIRNADGTITMPLVR